MKKILFIYGKNKEKKENFITKFSLENYVLSYTQIDKMLNTPKLTLYNETQNTYKKCYRILKEIVEEKMLSESFIIIEDEYNLNFMNFYNLIRKYNYETFIINLSPEDEEYTTILKNNFSRIRDKFYYTFLTEENYLENISVKTIDLSKYVAINHIGDIHGCRTVLNNLEIKSNEFYIFLGDYLDRGIEVVETFKYLKNLMSHDNIIFLKGNHENHIKNYLMNNVVYSNDFKETLKCLNQAKISKKEIKEFYNRLKPVFIYKYNEKTILCTHGGLPTFPEDIYKIDTQQLIKGVGGYDVNIDQIFDKNKYNNFYQAHGHRNFQEGPILTTKTSFNLNCPIEGGDCLRILKLTKEGFSELYFKNEIFNEKYKTDFGKKDMFNELYKDTDIRTKEFDNGIVSFNFTRKTFFNKNWNSKTILARGLFCEKETQKIVARGYEKFFSVNENEHTSLDKIKNLQYPITGYVKENGFLGLVGVHNKELLFCSKSTIDSDFAKTLETLFNKQVINKKELIDELETKNINLIFEVIDNVNDPHIINYNQSQKIVLLDIVYRDFTFKKYSYEKLCEFAKKYNLTVKEKAFVFNTYEEFIEEYQKIIKYDYKYNDQYIEGFVFEDNSENVFHFKAKSGYYKFWKIVRNSLEKYQANHSINVDKMIYQLSFNEMSEKEDDIRFIYNKIKATKYITLYKLQELID